MKQPMRPSRVVEIIFSFLALGAIIALVALLVSGRGGPPLTTALIGIAGVSMMVMAMAQLVRKNL
ncbi:MAG: hypothetical protein LBK42_05400 [Propionibacteriaceae bacterium]|nr:hypothetical protein [Propionibacteriaceae bacterium]